MSFYDELCGILGKENVLINEPMKNHTTFRVGGPADYFVTPQGITDLAALSACLCTRQIPRMVLGNGSNLLVSDKGYRGVVIWLHKGFDEIRTEGNMIEAYAGALLSKVAVTAKEHGLAGLAFASGIPGTVGGALLMNAGAYGGELSQVVLEADCLERNGASYTIGVEEMELGYRTSIFARERKQDTIVRVRMKLEPGKREEIQTYMEELKEKRLAKQPLEYASAGSTFKRPQGHYAGQLIEEAGLKGLCIGDAQVSEKHCGFVINRGNATAGDIWALMVQVMDTVETKFGVRLEPEVKRIGDFS